MAANKYVSIAAGVLTEIQAKDTSAGAGDAGKIVALNSAGFIDETMFPAPELRSFTASGAIAAGDLVNIFNSTGVKARKADASGGVAKRSHGFALAAIADTVAGKIYFDGILGGLSGMTIGATQFLSGATPGARVETPPSTSAYIVQEVGVAISATELEFTPHLPIVLA